VFLPYVLPRNDSEMTALVKAGMSIGIFNSIGYFAQATALETTAASNTAFICSLTVLVVPILDMIFKKKDVYLLKFMPALLAISGVALIEKGAGNELSFGDLVALIQPLMFGIAYWRTENFAKQCTTRETSLAFTGGMVLSVVLCSMIWATGEVIAPALAEGELVEMITSVYTTLKAPAVLAALAWTGIFTTALTSFGETIALKQLTAAEVSNTISSQSSMYINLFIAPFLFLILPVLLPLVHHSQQ